MRDLDLTTLRLFIAVCDHRNIGRAADQEHLTPSAVSKRIAQLEHVYGTQLFHRGRSGVEPTSAGFALAEHARSIIFQSERLDVDMAAFSSAQAQAQVRILASPSAIAESLPDDTAAFLRLPAHQRTRIYIEEALTRDVVRMLSDGSNAVGVCWANADLRTLQTRPYRTDELALAVHPEHHLAGEGQLSFEQTLDYDHVGLPPSSAVQIMLQRAAAQAGRTLMYRVIVSNFDAALRVVSANLAISIIPRQICHSFSGKRQVKVIPLTNSWRKRPFSICFRDYDSLPPAARSLVEYLESRATGEGA
jgi:DNA-binding transcriptional LysR family regulator